jgi:hypothetical protein
MRALRIAVIVLGVLIVVTTGVIIAVIAGRLSRGAAGPARPAATAQIEIPAGAHIEAMTAAADRVILGLVLPGGERQLVVVDLASGKNLGTIDLRPAP